MNAHDRLANERSFTLHTFVRSFIRVYASMRIQIRRIMEAFFAHVARILPYIVVNISLVRTQIDEPFESFCTRRKVARILHYVAGAAVDRLVNCLHMHLHNPLTCEGLLALIALERTLICVRACVYSQIRGVVKPFCARSTRILTYVLVNVTLVRL
jgi:hypothetical protein